MGRADANSTTEIPPGTLYMLILKSLARLGPRHGYDRVSAEWRQNDGR